MKEKKDILFLINPKSGVGGKRSVPRFVRTLLDKSKFNVTIKETQYVAHACELTAEAVARGVDIVVAVGGDGTVNEVARSLIGSNTALGIIPCGSGNGFARHLGIPMNIKKSIEFLNTAQPTVIDYGKLNGHPFFCSCGMGFDARVSNDFAKSGSRGVFTYIKTSLVDWVTYKPETYYVETPHFKSKFKAFVVACGNASQYGNNAYITPFASMRDGMFTVSILSPFSTVEMPLMAAHLFRHTFSKSSHMTTLTTSWLRIVRESAGPVHYDGEPCEMDAELVIEMVPDGIKVMARPDWDGTCAPVPLYRQLYEMFAGSLPSLPKLGKKK